MTTDQKIHPSFDHAAPPESAISGLTTEEAARRLKETGPNTIPEKHVPTWLIFLMKMWAPVPWMLEATVILELILGHNIEAVIMSALVVFNALISTLEENNAQHALALLRQKLTVSTRVLRDGHWQALPGADLVPGDVVYLRMGDVLPADMVLLSGQALVDQSTLTGESMPVEAVPGTPVYAGCVVRHGEAAARITATGVRTRFGRTAELVRLAKSTGHLEKIVFSIARNLVILDAFLVLAVLFYALLTRLSLHDILPFALILLVASVPVALPATFTFATALGAVELVRRGVLVTRLSAIEEAASMQVLCSDKTGTLTENHLVLSTVHPFPPYRAEDVLRLAAMASDEATQDPLDLAILARVANLNLAPDSHSSRRTFIPFEPSTKRSEAVYDQDGNEFRVMKGAPQVIAALDPELDENYPQKVNELSSQGLRILAVASGLDQHIHLAGLLAFQDPPREDSYRLVTRMKEMGIRVVMLTGDALDTARAIAAQVGIGDHSCRAETIRDNLALEGEGCDVYGEVLPEEKFYLVQKFQNSGFTVGMTGDGVNDAPALRQAEVGIAVSNATDVAKAAASLVLTTSGLGSLVFAVETSRRIYQRMLTYTLNKIIKTIEIAFFLSFGLIFTGVFVTTPLLMVLLLFTNDFVTMTIASDRVKPSPQPNRWAVNTIVLGAASLTLPILALSFAVFAYADYFLKLPLEQLQTLLFVMLVYTGQGTIYLIRERRHFWGSLPGRWLLIGTTMDILLIAFLASQGILMAAVPLSLIAGLLGVIIIYLILLDFVKVPVFKRLNLR